MFKLHASLENLRSRWRFFRPLRPLWPWFARSINDVYLLRRTGRIARATGLRTSIANALRPLDIVLVRSTFRLADYVIPGYFHHAGVYLGPLEGRRWQSAVAEDHSACGYVIEATHQGVRLATVEAFLNVDTVAILRDPSLRGPRERRLRTVALHELGKQYDYYFDIEDRHRQFCSKLVATIFGHVDFRSALVTESTLVPDHLVERALRDHGRALRPVLLVDDGGQIVVDRLDEHLARRIGLDPVAACVAADSTRSV